MKKIKKLLFKKKKYYKELFIDCHFYNEIEIGNFRENYTSNFYEIHLIKKGKINLFIDKDIKISLENNNMVFLIPEKVRHWQTIGEITGRIIVFKNDFIENFFSDFIFLQKLNLFQNNKKEYILKLKENEANYYNSFFNEIEKEIISLRNDSLHLICSSLYYFLVKLNRHFSEKYFIKKDSFEISNPLVVEFLKLIETEKKHSVKEYIEKLNVSRTHLNNILKKQFNCSASYLIKKKLLQKIKNKLLFSKKNISEIAFEMDFSESSNFIRFFKKQTGKTPNEFIKHFSK